MARPYHQLLRYVFKRFSVLSAPSTCLPTIGYYLTRPSLPASDKPALCTMNILPPMMTVWHHFARKNIGEGADIVIFDCSGKLHPRDFPGARVLPFLNLYAATKCDEFLYRIAKKRRIGWLCDDDMFLMSPASLEVLRREFADPQTASVSFRPREWWEFDIGGKRIKPSSSYCTAINRDIFVSREHLSLAPADGNTHPSPVGKPPKRYDTFDKANEILLTKGYRCCIVPKEEEEMYTAAFSGLSGAVMLLSYFRTRGETLGYFLDPPAKQWGGNLLFGLMSAMLSICTIQELAARLKGAPYPLPSLPSRDELLEVLESRRTFLRPEQTLEQVEKTSERLRANL